MHVFKGIKLILTLAFLIPSVSWAQKITGSVQDGALTPLEFVAVAAIKPIDSTLISYASTNALGEFELVNIKGGEIIFQVHLIGFKTFQKNIEFKNEDINMGSITLEDDNQLEEVIVTVISPISIKKDTVAYNTNAFKIRVDDNVEDLLKKLPGVEVDASGKVTAQGEDITKIYVDGKEFFSGDPAIATKNLSADAIKTIEVIDERSEQSRVSGVGDSERIKVINLTLKDDSKVNDFGKFQGGYGTDDRYLTSLSYNRFSSKLQTSVIGKYNNVNTSGSDISEIIQFNGGRGGGSNAGGFLTTGVGGVNMGYEFKKDQNLNGDYFYNYSGRTSGDVESIRTEYIDDIELLTRSNSSSENISNRNNANFSYRDRSSKVYSLELRGKVGSSRNDGKSLNSVDRYNGDGGLDLQSVGNSNSDSESSNGSFDFDYTKRFKEGSKRNISTEGRVNASNSNSISNNDQFNKFNVSNPVTAFDSKQEIVKTQDGSNTSFEYELDYTEPLTDNHLIEFNGDLTYNSNEEDVNQSKYENDVLQDPLVYSEYYRETNVSGKMSYKYDNDKFTLSAGARLIEQTQDFGLENEPTNTFKNSYMNVNPELSIRYNPKRGEFFRFRSQKRVNLPSSSELSPAINDFNPLYIRQGNPDLTPEDNYSIYGLYGKHDFASGFSFFTRLSYNFTENSIGNSQNTNELRVRTSSYENLGNKNDLGTYLSLGNRLKVLGVRYRIRLSANYREYFSLINNIINETQTKNGYLDVSFENNKKDNIDASVGVRLTKDNTTFSSGNNADRDFLQQSYYTKIDWNVSNRFNVNSQFKYDIYSDSSFETDEAVPIWNATVSYSLTESKSLMVMISALDILNESIGLERTSSGNYFEEVNRDVLGNYYMFSITYNLNGNKGPKGSNSSGNNRRRRRS
tara:strand:- start:23297 stop:26026 length:2730 start_codon:yes stop_codon:yes gene_type:complete